MVRKILQKTINLLMTNLKELQAVGDDEYHQFQYGEKVAYAECLEAIQFWDKQNICKLNFDIERKFLL